MDDRCQSENFFISGRRKVNVDFLLGRNELWNGFLIPSSISQHLVCDFVVKSLLYVTHLLHHWLYFVDCANSWVEHVRQKSVC
jgi:hypothetical protein